jgi:hypothetical protein
MDDNGRRDEIKDTRRRLGSDKAEVDQKNDGKARRELESERPGLTEREREERWPIG